LQRGPAEPRWDVGEPAGKRSLTVVDRSLVRVRRRRHGRRAVGVLPGDLRPYEPSALIANAAGTCGEGFYQEQTTALLTVGIIDLMRFAGAAAVGNRDLHHGPVPGHLNCEPATASAGSVPDRVAGEFGRDADYVVAGLALWQ
jgi:hypothetical protein